MRIALVLPGALALALATGCTRASRSTPVVAPRPSRPADTSARIERAVHNLLNAHRGSRKLPPLTLDPRISDVARGHSVAMAAGKVPFGHDGFTERAAVLRDGRPNRVAENVAHDLGHPDPARQIVQAWVQSPEHRGNIEGSYDRTGIGAARNATGDVYVTQIFVGLARPRQCR